ncbi:MAG: NAD(P)H-quinone oxidoreductase, partial [Acutalibacteraceae bacterium]|nr:NAD(P)H-quinone oxidoreductase [Acutalibacteraceae bacterium]
MKAILVNDDRSLSWSNVPDPVLKSDEVMVKIEYAALNRADLMQREGDYPPPAGCPEWMGLEISGTITEIADEAKANSNWKIGDKVCALLGGGGYAEYVAVRYDMLMPVPENCSMAEAAAIPEAFATAYLNLFIEGKIEKGNTLLMNAGASGLASVIIPMAKAFGIRVITTVLTDEIAASITHLNADRVVVTTKEDISEVLKEELEKGHSVDVAIDCLGGEIMGKCIHYLTHGARWIMIAALAGTKTEIDLKNIYVRNVRIIGSTLRSRTPAVKAQILAELVKNVWPKV